jgi:hypothetical protein
MLKNLFDTVIPTLSGAKNPALNPRNPTPETCPSHPTLTRPCGRSQTAKDGGPMPTRPQGLALGQVSLYPGHLESAKEK